MGRLEVMRLYRRIGFFALVFAFHVRRQLRVMTIDRKSIDESVDSSRKWQKRIASQIEWRLDFPFEPCAAGSACYHGGASIERLGCDVEKIEAQTQVINADVLDAWFPPSPKVETTLKSHLAWMIRTSPPTNALEIQSKIADVRRLSSMAVVMGAGSSDLIFRAFRQWLNRDSCVLLIKPCYAEYEFVCRKVIRCKVDQLELEAFDGFRLDRARILARLKAKAYDLVVVVNPNNPTGAFLRREYWMSYCLICPQDAAYGSTSATSTMWVRPSRWNRSQRQTQRLLSASRCPNVWHSADFVQAI